MAFAAVAVAEFARDLVNQRSVVASLGYMVADSRPGTVDQLDDLFQGVAGKDETRASMIIV